MGDDFSEALIICVLWRSSDPLIILNKGEKMERALWFVNCGAAVPRDDYAVLEHLRKPYRHPHI